MLPFCLFFLILLRFLCGQLAFFSAAAVQLAVQALNFKPHAAHFLRHRVGHVDLIQRAVVHHTLAAPRARCAPGTPTAVALSGTASSTTAPAATRALSPTRNGPQHLCARTDEHVISKRRVTLALVFARAAERHTLIQCAVVTDNGGFADDDTHTVVDEQIFTDRRARVNLYTRFAARALRDIARDKFHIMAEKPVCLAVRPHRLEAGIQKINLRTAAAAGSRAITASSSAFNLENMT